MPKERKSRIGENSLTADTPSSARRGGKSVPTPTHTVVYRHEEHDTSDDEERPKVKRKPFRLMDLPSELRLRVYEHVLLQKDLIDLNPMNYRLILPRLAILLVNRQLHEEAYRVFYSQMFRLFSMHGRFFYSKKPLLMRLSPRYRAAIRALELRLGPGWSNPPASQKITPGLGLMDCINVRLLRIFVEIDPSEPTFAGFRGKGATEDTYKEFCVDLLSAILQECPNITVVEIDAYPAVRRDAPLISALRALVDAYDKVLRWGPACGWGSSSEDGIMFKLNAMISQLAISPLHTALVPVHA